MTPWTIPARGKGLAPSRRYLPAMTQTLPRLLSARETMRALAISRSTLTRLQSAGVLQPVRLRPGGWPRFRADELAELIERGGSR